MSNIMEKIIADLVKGAQATEGFMRGSRVNVEIGQDRGREEKLAGFMPAAAGLLGKGLGAAMRNPKAALGLAGAGVGALSGAASAEPGHRMEGAMKGGLVGGGAGLAGHAAAGALNKAHPWETVAGMMPKSAALETHYLHGSYAAADAFHVKKAFLSALLPIAGQLLGGTALRAGTGALARGAGGKALGNIAGKVLPRMNSGIGGMATDMAGGSIGGSIAQKIAPPPPPQGM
jgi:hypothetical protein